MWHAIKLAPPDYVCLFWLEWADDVTAIWEPEHYFIGKRGAWPAVCKATHWMPLPSEPNDHY